MVLVINISRSTHTQRIIHREVTLYDNYTLYIAIAIQRWKNNLTSWNVKTYRIWVGLNIELDCQPTGWKFVKHGWTNYFISEVASWVRYFLWGYWYYLPFIQLVTFYWEESKVLKHLLPKMKVKLIWMNQVGLYVHFFFFSKSIYNNQSERAVVLSVINWISWRRK